jgi:hypothetical protein
MSKVKKMFGKGNKKQKGAFSFIDYRPYKIAREIENHSKGKRTGDFTQLELALMSKDLIKEYLSETKNMKTVRSIIDYQYNTYTFRVQIFEATLVLF